LVETKDDRNLTDEEVLAKKHVAHGWAHYATDSLEVSYKGHYLMVGETHLMNVPSNWSVLLVQAGA
jgi:hypothetical protein